MSHSPSSPSPGVSVSPSILPVPGVSVSHSPSSPSLGVSVSHSPSSPSPGVSMLSHLPPPQPASFSRVRLPRVLGAGLLCESGPTPLSGTQCPAEKRDGSCPSAALGAAHGLGPRGCRRRPLLSCVWGPGGASADVQERSGEVAGLPVPWGAAVDASKGVRGEGLSRPTVGSRPLLAGTQPGTRAACSLGGASC